MKEFEGAAQTWIISREVVGVGSWQQEAVETAEEDKKRICLWTNLR